MAKTVTVNTSQLSINWQPNTQYRISLTEGFVVDASGSRTPSPAVANLRTLTTNTAPTVSASYPTNGDTDTDNFYSISLSFNRAMQKGTTGTVRLYDDSDTLIVSYAIADTEISVSGNNIIIDVDGLITQLTSYYLLIDSTCFKDLDGFFFAGYTTSTDFTYTTAGTALGQYTYQRTISNEFVTDINNTYITTNQAELYSSSTGSLLRTLSNGTLSKVSDTLAMTRGGYDATTGKLANVYIYTPSDGNLLYRIGNPDLDGGGTTDGFGSTIDRFDLNDNFAVVAATDADGLPGTGYLQGGIIYVFSMATGNIYINIDHPDDLTQYAFGESVAISNNFMAVGTPGTSFTDLSGKVYIYDTTSFVLTLTLDNPDLDNSPTNPFVDFQNSPGSLRYDRFGAQLAFKGSWLAVSAPGEGRIYLYNGNVYVRSIQVPFYFTSDELTYQKKYDSRNNPDIYGDYLVVTRMIDSVFDVNNDLTLQSRAAKILLYDMGTGVLVQEITYNATGTDYFTECFARITENYLSITITRISGTTTYIYNKA